MIGLPGDIINYHRKTAGRYLGLDRVAVLYRGLLFEFTVFSGAA